MSGTPGEIDKEQHYGRYQDQEDKRNKLGMKMAYKALDIPEDDMQIKADKTTTINGVGTKGMIGVAAAAGLPVALLAAFLLWQGAPSVKPPTTATVPSARSEFEAVYQQKQKDGSWKEIKREPLDTGGQ